MLISIILNLLNRRFDDMLCFLLLWLLLLGAQFYIYLIQFPELVIVWNYVYI